MQETETRIQMIKMVNEFKLTVVHFALPNPMEPDADLCMLLDLPLDKKTVENQDWATGPPVLRAAGLSGVVGRWAVAGRGPRAAGPRACF